MSTVTLGKVSITPGGSYSPTTLYQTLTAVSRNGNSYLSTRISQGIVPGESEGWESFWMLLCTKGDVGRGLTILDYFPTYTDLINTITNPSAGDAYGVGDPGDYTIYTYTESGSWVELGTFAIGDAVRYTPMSLDDGEKEQARNNIGAQSNTWMPTAAEVGARDVMWLPTPDEIGAVEALAEEGVITWTNGTDNGSVLVRQGKSVQLYLRGKAARLDPNATISSWVEIPASFLPRQEIIAADPTRQGVFVRVKPTGTVDIQNIGTAAVLAGQTMFFNVPYICY